MTGLEIALAVICGRMRKSVGKEEYGMMTDSLKFIGLMYPDLSINGTIPPYSHGDVTTFRNVAEIVIRRTIESNQQQIAELRAIVTELQNALKK